MAALVLVGVWHPQAAGLPDATTPVPGFFDLPVTGGTATYDALGLTRDERGVALAVLARELHGQGTDRGEVARLLGKEVQTVAPTRATLISKGMI